MQHDDRAPARGHRGVVAATVLTVAAVVLGLGVLRGGPPGHDGHGDAAARLAGSPTAAGEPTLDLDLGPTGPADVTGCLSPDFAGDPAQVTVLYGVRQRTHDGSVPVLVLRNRAGEVRLCDQFGGDYPAQAPPDRATAAEPVAFYSNGRRDWNCQQRTGTLRRFTLTEWLATASAVNSVRVRFVVNGRPGPWFTTRPVDGLAHLQGWLDGPLHRSARVVVEHQVLDAQGGTVTQTTLPSNQRVAGCSGGSAQIG